MSLDKTVQTHTVLPGLRCHDAVEKVLESQEVTEHPTAEIHA